MHSLNNLQIPHVRKTESKSEDPNGSGDCSLVRLKERNENCQQLINM
jgi:hypothetical protein